MDREEFQEGLTVSVVVCNPEKEMFEKFIKSLTKYTPQLKQLLIFDNNSHPDTRYILSNSLEDINSNGFDINFLLGEDNFGFGYGHNENLKLVKYNHFAVLNDDIEFFEDWSTPMMKALQDKKVGQVCMRRDTCNAFTQQGLGCYTGHREEPDYAEASCMMMKTEQAERFGLFDIETFEFAYFEDADLSMRIKSTGLIIKSVDVNWKHYRATTTQRIEDIDIQGYHAVNQYKFRKKWNSYILKKKFGETIVVRRDESIGDVFLLTPLLIKIKKDFPNCIIILMTKTPQMMLQNELVDAIINPGIPVPCDYYLNLNDSYEKDFNTHIVDSYINEYQLQICNFPYDKEMKRTGDLYISKQAQKTADIILSNRTEIKDFIVMDVSKTWEGKQWFIGNYVKLAERIKKETKMQIVFVGSNPSISDAEDCDLFLVNMLDIISTATVLSRAAMYVGHVGLMSHVAQSVNIPSTVLFGCELPQFSCESLETFSPVVSPVKCAGCRNRYNSGIMVECNRKHICMEKITVESVFNSVMGLINKYYKELVK